MTLEVGVVDPEVVTSDPFGRLKLEDLLRIGPLHPPAFAMPPASDGLNTIVSYYADDLDAYGKALQARSIQRTVIAAALGFLFGGVLVVAFKRMKT